MTKAFGTCGLGLRREFLHELITVDPKPIDFLEVAPENWLDIGGKRAKLFNAYAEAYPIICHGLSLSLGAIAPINTEFVKRLKKFFTEYNTLLYSEHLSYCSDEQGQLYDLIPMPFTEEAVHYVANRVKQVQDILQQRIALENISYYACLDTQLSESEFINAVITEADCLLLLDINNIYVNSVNHGYDANQFLASMPGDRVAYCHIAGHWQKTADLIIDTHGDTVIEPVWQLLDRAYQYFGLLPTLLERDHDVPPLDEILREVERIKSAQAAYQQETVYHA